MPQRSLAITIVLTTVSFLHAHPTWPTGQLVAHGRLPRSLGHADQGYIDLYEFGMWLNEAGPSSGFVKRCGASRSEGSAFDGSAPFSVLPGTYAVLLHQPEWSVRPAVVPHIELGRTKLDRDIIPGLDYSLVCGERAAWKSSDGKDSWDVGQVFHQVFLAKGTSITHAAYRLAGTKSPSARLTIHKLEANRAPEQWEQIGPERIDESARTQKDNWVGWRSGEVPTVPGQTYALRIEAWPRGDESGLTVVAHRDSLGNGYDDGTAFVDGTRQSYDLYGTIGSDSDGTVIPYMRVLNTKPGKYGEAGTWSQTWVAKGHSLAGADFLVASTEDAKTVMLEAQVYEGAPEGKPVGLPKRGQGAAWGPGSAWVGVAWQPGETPLEPGKTYRIEWRGQDRLSKYRGGIVNHPANTYPNGMAFRDGKAEPQADLEMTLIEYSRPAPSPPQAAVYKPTGRNLLTNGDFEQGDPSQAPKDIAGWTRWQLSPTTLWYGPYGQNKSQAVRAVGGSINGTKMDGGVVQKVGHLSASKTYRLSGWVGSNVRTDRQFLSAVGYDPTGQTENPKASTTVWEGAGRDVDRFEQIVINGIRPDSDSVSIWLRAANKIAEQATYTVDFDDIVLEESGR